MVQLTEIQSILASLPKANPGWAGWEWTKAMKRALIELASVHGCKACASGCLEANWPEWLYDVTWLRQGEDDQKGLLTDSPFVAEIEWSNKGAVMDEFQKLLLARADTKLMMFSATTIDGGKGLMDKMARQIKAYSRTDVGDRYILVCMSCRNNKDYEYICQEYVHQ
jgi:hypothetical protein